MNFESQHLRPSSSVSEGRGGQRLFSVVTGPIYSCGTNFFSMGRDASENRCPDTEHEAVKNEIELHFITK